MQYGLMIPTRVGYLLDENSKYEDVAEAELLISRIDSGVLELLATNGVPIIKMVNVTVDVDNVSMEEAAVWMSYKTNFIVIANTNCWITTSDVVTVK